MQSLSLALTIVFIEVLIMLPIILLLRDPELV